MWLMSVLLLCLHHKGRLFEGKRSFDGGDYFKYFSQEKNFGSQIFKFWVVFFSMSMAFLLKGKRMMVKIFGVKFSCTSRLFCSNISQSFSKKNKLSIFRTNIVQKINLNDSIFIKFTHVLDPTAKSPHSRCRHGRYVSRK